MHNSSGVIVQESDDEGTELDSPIPIIAGLQPYRFTPRRLTQIDGVAPALDLSNATNLTHQSRGRDASGRPAILAVSRGYSGVGRCYNVDPMIQGGAWDIEAGVCGLYLAVASPREGYRTDSHSRDRGCRSRSFWQSVAHSAGGRPGGHTDVGRRLEGAIGPRGGRTGGLLLPGLD